MGLAGSAISVHCRGETCALAGLHLLEMAMAIVVLSPGSSPAAMGECHDRWCTERN